MSLFGICNFTICFLLDRSTYSLVRLLQNNLCSQIISYCKKYPSWTTSACRPQSASKSEDCADVHGNRTEYVVRVFLIACNELLCGHHDNKQVFAVALYKQLT
jgi:hypothetical protein